MPSDPSVLIVSNGHGEDAVGALLGRRLATSGLRVRAYPLVGTGDGYREAAGEISLLEPRRTFPSGGFSLRGSWRSLREDLGQGLISHWRAQRATLAGERARHVLAVAIGDTYCLWMASAALAPAVFVSTAKSVYHEPHTQLEHLLLRRAAVIWTRDQPTAHALARAGLPARYAGNPLMDTIPRSARALPLPPEARTILLLPGSRPDALRNLLLLLKVALQVSAEEGGAFVAALPRMLPVVDVVRAAAARGWEVDGEFLRSGPTAVLLSREFGAALTAATVVVGLAGTANEQAAGLGKPVVAFPVDGAAQFTSRFLALQQRLLGHALVAALDWEDAARAVVHLLRDPEERRWRSVAGRERMGTGGAVAQIAENILTMARS